MREAQNYRSTLRSEFRLKLLVKNYLHMRHKILTVVTMNTAVFKDVAPCVQQRRTSTRLHCVTLPKPAILTEFFVICTVFGIRFLWSAPLVQEICSVERRKCQHNFAFNF